MVETKPTQSKHNKIILFLMAIIFAIFFVSSPLCIIANAESNRVTSVIEDLQTDPNFKVEGYPSDTEDNTLKVIQIAESTAKELFIYVYQPSAVTRELRATSINISTSIGENFAPKNYTLTFLNSRGVFQKYVVNDFYVKNDALRYYDIISIFRAFNETIDKKPGADQAISERSYEVGQLWTACTVNGEVSYSYTETETIVINEKYTGFVRYNNGFKLYAHSCDSHYVAFSTNKPIDRLIEADISYIYRTVEARDNLTGLHPNYGTSQKVPNLTVKASQKASNDPSGIGGNKYTWNRIETVTSFINNEDLTQETKNKLNGKQWVLRFTETDYKSAHTIMGYDMVYWTEVQEVTVLRLNFETDGIIYNLGVVDNKQTNLSNIPDNKQKGAWQAVWDLVTNILRIILYVIIVIVAIKLIIVVINLIKAIFSKRR